MPSRGTVLVIDDDFDFVEFARMVLESDGYKVYAAERADEGLAQARRIQPDVILLDVVLSYSLDGLNVSRDIRSDPQLKGTPLVLISAIVTDDDLDPLREEEDGPTYDLFMTKPVEPADLLEQVHRFVPRGDASPSTS